MKILVFADEIIDFNKVVCKNESFKVGVQAVLVVLLSYLSLKTY
jgi:hypothetical protein